MKKFIIQIFTDETGMYSSKRFVGILCTFALVISLVVNAFVAHEFDKSSSIVNSVALLAFGALGLTSIDKWSKRK
jgi:hypothetical protein